MILRRKSDSEADRLENVRIRAAFDAESAMRTWTETRDQHALLDGLVAVQRRLTRGYER